MSDFNKLVGQIREAGGQVYGICAQEEDVCNKTKTDWNIDFDLISDPFNTLAREFDVIISVRRGYPNGMGQPGVICQTTEKATLYKWRIIPSIQNTGGASDRPVISEIWSIVQDKLAGKEVDPSREENISLTSKKDWRTMHLGVINLLKHLFTLPFSKKSAEK